MGTSKEGVLQLTPPSYPRGILFGDQQEPKQRFYEESATQQYALGTKLVYGDGRIFRYAYNGGVALVKGYMTCSATNTANCVEELQNTSGANVEIGDYEIVVDVTNASGITDDLYAEGTLIVNKATGMGDTYKILSCKLLTTTTARLLLETPIRTAWDATTEITLLRNRWKEIVVAPTTLTREPAGVPAIAVTINYYCWVQTGGLVGIYVDTGDTVVAGNNVGSPGTHAVAGTCGTQTAGTFPIWGICSYVATAAETAGIYLTLDS